VWMFGWRLHRFLLVAVTSLTAGLMGLNVGPENGMQPMVGALLMALTAGVMAVTLMRVLAFAAGGLAMWLIVHGLAPTWNQPLVCVLAGGLMGALLFRFWIITLTSFGGTLLLTYSTLCLIESPGSFTPAEWADQNAVLLNLVAGGLTLLGLMTQVFLERMRARQTKERKEMDEEEARMVQEEVRRKVRRRGWVGWVTGKSARKAG
jgi:hypothetical protein